jgi:hypothetical protein
MVIGNEIGGVTEYRAYFQDFCGFGGDDIARPLLHPSASRIPIPFSMPIYAHFSHYKRLLDLRLAL